MPDAIKMRIHQDLVNYKTPTSFQLRESYPLPPYSTVIGMVHNACGYDSYVPMAVSVQGTHRSRVNNYQTGYFFKNAHSYEKERHQICLEIQENGKKFGITRSTFNVELLTDVELVLHIKPEDPARFQEIYEGLARPAEYISLGRREDIARIDSIAIVQVEEAEEEEERALPYDAYIPVEFRESGSYGGTIYDLNVKYTVDKAGFRRWDKQKVFFAPRQSATVHAEEPYLRDSEGDIVFWTDKGIS